jgi:hypothetical protein
MAILTYRSVKESALTYDEMDDNFRYFKENPELNSIKISVKDNLNDIASLPIGSITGGLNWNINDDAEELNTDFRLFVKTTDTLWDPIVTQGTVVEVNTATADIKGIVKVGPSLTIDTEGLLEVDKFTDASISSYVGETRYIQTDGTSVGWLPFDINANLPNQSNQQGHYLMSNGSQVGWMNVDALPDQSGETGKFLTTNGTDASWSPVDALPDQSGETGKFLTTNGTDASWSPVDALPDQSGETGKFLTTNGTDADWTNFLGTEIRVSLTPDASDNSTKLASTAFVNTAISNLIDGADPALNTLKELSIALGNDADHAAEMITLIGTKAPGIHTHSEYLGLSGGTVTGTIYATDFILTSDRRLKSNIKDLETESVPLLKVINPVTFNNGDIGFIAQDFENRVPELVNTMDDGYLALKYSKITALLWKQNQELLKRIENLENR